MQATQQATVSFRYKAQGAGGTALSGAVDAVDIGHARAQIEALGLRVIEIEPEPPRGVRAMSSDDFAAFNRQLGYLTSAGLPLEQGLRLVAQDMRSGRLAATIREVASELERGKSLGEIFDRARGRFPSAYGRLLEAGVRSNNLPGILFGLARHLELLQRLRGMLWRTAAYPAMVLLGLTGLVIFLTVAVLPQFRTMFAGMMIPLPAATRAMLWLAMVLPGVLVWLVVALIAAPIVIWVLRRMGWDQPLVDHVVLRLPLIGPIVHKSMLAGWCDALRMGVESGMDLPAAIELAGDTALSPALRRDGQHLCNLLAEGKTLELAGRGRVLPMTIPTAIALGAAQHNLPAVLRGLAELYQQQAEARMLTLPGVLTPLLFVLLAMIVGFVLLAVMLPLIGLVQAIL
jgi:type II secretory pathway component PulF